MPGGLRQRERTVGGRGRENFLPFIIIYNSYAKEEINDCEWVIVTNNVIYHRRVYLSDYKIEVFRKKIQASSDFSELVTSALPVQRSNQLRYEATAGRAGHFKLVHQCHSEVYND